jgi:hypothetical protein
MNASHQKLVVVLQEARQWLSRPDNDFAWSSWEDAPTALREIEGIIARIQSGDMPKRSDIEVLFLPTGPIQEVSVSSGWGQEFLDLAKRFDRAVAFVYGEKDSEHKNFSDQTFSVADFQTQLAGGRLRWLATALAVASIGLFIDVFSKGDKAEFYFPLHIRGRSALWTIGIAFVVWTAIAFVNWKNWLRKKNAN